MAHQIKHQPPLDVLQGMINGILIEIGKALASGDKEHGRTFAGGSTRLQTTIPSTAENFHRALDELEIDIMRAKAVLQRDLEEKRAERLAKEAPPVVATAPSPLPLEPSPQKTPTLENNILNEAAQDNPDIEKSNISSHQGSDNVNGIQGNSILDTSSANADAVMTQKSDLQQTQSSKEITQTASSSEPVGLGISTNQSQTQTQAQEPLADTADATTSAIDSLFDLGDIANGGNDAFNFDDMDFSVDATSGLDGTQTAATDFDLSTFGNEPQDFNMLDLPTTTEANTNNIPATKDDDIFADLGGTGDANMDLDLGNMDMGEGNSFDDLFLPGDGDDLGTGGGEMEHGDFDREFFGLE